MYWNPKFFMWSGIKYYDLQIILLYRMNHGGKNNVGNSSGVDFRGTDECSGSF